jgi:hypothetical protein
MAPNRCIYCAPFNATTFLKIDTTTDTVSTFGAGGGTETCVGAVLGRDGMVYCLPFYGGKVYRIDPNTDTVSTYQLFSTTANRFFRGGALLDSGEALMVPSSTVSYAYKLVPGDPPVAPALSATSLPVAAFRWFGGVRTCDGYVIGIPNYRGSVLRVGVSSQAVDTFGSLGETTSVYKWAGGALALDGKVVCAPYDHAQVLTVNAAGQSTQVVSSGVYYSTALSKYQGCVTGPDGATYFIPYNASYLGRLSVNRDSYSIDTANSHPAGAFCGGVLSDNGCIYCVPAGASYVYRLGTPQAGKIPLDAVLSPYLNKL